MATEVNPRYLSYNKEQVQAILDGVKQVDTTPTADSRYPVSSGAVKTALDNVASSVNSLSGEALKLAESSDPTSLLTE